MSKKLLSIFDKPTMKEGLAGLAIIVGDRMSVLLRTNVRTTCASVVIRGITLVWYFKTLTSGILIVKRINLIAIFYGVSLEVLYREGYAID